MTAIAPYGSWKSPVTTDLIVSGAVGLGQISLDGNEVYWVEDAPLRRRTDGHRAPGP